MSDTQTDTQRTTRRLVEQIESRSQQRGIDPHDAADELWAEGGHSAFDMYAALSAVQERRLSEQGAWGGVSHEERVRRLAAAEGIGEREAYDRIGPDSPGAVRQRIERSVAARQAAAQEQTKIKKLSEDGGISLAEAEQILFDQGVIR